MVTSFQLAAGKLIQARTETVNKFSQPPFLPRPMTGLAVLSAVAFPTKNGHYKFMVGGMSIGFPEWPRLGSRLQT